MASIVRRSLAILSLSAAIVLLTSAMARAGIITTFTDRTTFEGATGASSITGAIPNLGNVGTGPNVVGDVTFDSLSGNLFLGSAGLSGSLGTLGWSTLIPGNDIAISGLESFKIGINGPGRITSLGFVLHEPTDSSGLPPDTCNFSTCPDSTFALTLMLGTSVVDDVLFNPANDALTFFGVESDMAFDRASIVEISGNADNEYFGEFLAVRVPAPTTILLLVLGLVGLGATTRRRRQD